MEYDINDTSLGLELERETLAWLRAHEPVHWDSKNEAWLLTRHADIRHVLHRPHIWSSARGFFVPRHLSGAKSSIITMDDPEHATYRKLISRAFTPGMLQRQASRVRSLMDDAIDAIADRRTCDFVQSLAIPLPMAVIAAMVGFDDADAYEFSRLSDAMIEFSSASPGDLALLQRGGDAFSTFREHLRRAVADRRRIPRQDLLSILLESVDAGILRINDDPMQDDLFQFTVLLVVAGNETTRHTITWGMHALLENPNELDLIRSTRQTIPLAVEECLRWASVLRGLKRTALERTEIAGQKIRSGEQVILVYPSANRDEAAFEQPFELRVTRSPNPHLAFGEGNHYCLGANLARLEIRIALEQILERLPGLRLAPGARPIPKLTALVNGVARMDVVFDSVRPRSAAR
jgi:cytochrome P450 family 142 subfamily A polypeptide 1